MVTKGRYTYGLTWTSYPGKLDMRFIARPNPRDGKSAKNLAPIAYSGTAWAVLGLMRSAVPPKTQ